MLTSTEPFARIISIDPGTNCLGLSVLDVSHERLIDVVHVTTVHAPKLASRFEGIIELHGEKIAKLYALRKYLESAFHTWNPHYVASESPYMGRFPAAYAALVECLSTIRYALMDYDRNAPLNMIDPASVKQAVGVSGKSGDKSLMTQALRDHSALVRFSPDIDIEQLDEHSIDAISVGTAFCINCGFVEPLIRAKK